MAIRMLIALKGAGYDLAAGEVTDIFDATKESRFVDAKIAAKVDPLDRDGDGSSGGSLAVEEVIREAAGFALWRRGGGWYRITGPGLETPINLQGATAADEAFDAALPKYEQPG